MYPSVKIPVSQPTKITTSPVCMSSGVLAVKYANGVMMACDTLTTYGSMKMFKNTKRLISVGKHTLVGGSGDMSDFQFVKDELEKKLIDEYCLNDQEEIKASRLNSYFSTLQYRRRNKGDFICNSLLFGGIENGKPYLGISDYLGSEYTDNFICTGFWSHLATPLIRNQWHENLSEGECKGLIEECMKIATYRHDRALNRFILGKVSSDGVFISEPFSVKGNWDYKNFIGDYSL